MNLHVAVSGWLLGVPSGSNRRLLALAQHAAPLLGDGERLTVLHRRGFQPPFVLPRLHWQAVPIPAGPTWRRALAEFRCLQRTLRRLEVTVLDHGLLPAPRVDAALVQTVHDLRDLDGHGQRPRWLAALALRRTLGRATHCIVPSEWTAQRVRALAPGTAVTVVGNGVTVPPPASAQPPGDGALLHVGHLEPRKNLSLLLRALALLPAGARPGLQLAGADAGSGPRLRRLAADLGVASSVRWLGVVDEATLTQLYRDARAVVVPSRCEGFGLCALEGLAHGRPVLVADAGALPEVVGRAGTVLPPDDPEAWARAIAATADDRGEQLARRARAEAFSWPAAAARLVAVWRTAAATGN